MGVPGSRASLLSLVSLKPHPSAKDPTRTLLFRSKPSFLIPSPRSLLTGPPSQPTVSFFDPSLPPQDCPCTPLLPSRDAPSLPSSPVPSAPRQPVSRAATAAGTSHDTTSSAPSGTTYPNAAAARAASLSQLAPLSLYGHESGHHLRPSQSLRPKKHYYSFVNGASGIPKASTSSSGGGGGGSGGGGSSSNQASTLSSDTGFGFGKLNSHSRGQIGLSVQVGEDAYFLREDSLGVADGVGGWSGKAGANSAWFSKKVMHHCSFELARYEDTEDVKFTTYDQIDPVEILQRAYEKSLDESKLEGIVGSTTALVAVLRDDELRIANLGDCCCSIIRGNDYIFRSEEQQHSFNYPVQIGTHSKSTPRRDAQRYSVKVQKDDIVILSSDGLIDNLFDEDILEEVLRRVPCRPDRVSEALASRAKTVSIDQLAVASPFSQRANEEGIHYVGGKNDDISVLVAVVKDL